ncbi:DUF6221 family protein [Streptomyces sp. NBC_01591]|uniref:DUF6221 family protein n=1 Tax=Streptomyces sp. NBC_01591 TaxID=2975888 RepID=UPI002DDB8A6D|nr:DUF6221 family protein [Streptomyces sp. NBC_01591]WSD71732.1 DUF6221 family protein [Streptomyces sp. NBC_01591]
MDDLLQFLRDRLNEDEQTARSVEDRSAPWNGQWVADGHDTARTFNGHMLFYGHTGPLKPGLVDHVVRHDPARVLREVEAKRRAVELHGIVHREIGWLESGGEEYSETPVCGLCVPKHSHYQRREDVPEGPCLTVRLLALPYADHPDYRDAWRP